MLGRRLTEDAVVVAEELMPSTLAELDFTHIKAFATDVGGWTSHTAIIARGLGIPAVVGLRDFYRAARTGDADRHRRAAAARSCCTRRPRRSNATPTSGAPRRRRRRARAASAEELRAPLRTRDGVEVTLRANVELPVEYEWVNRYGAHGIGLFRSEFLLSHRGSMPNEDEQCEAYEELARIAGEDGRDRAALRHGRRQAVGRRARTRARSATPRSACAPSASACNARSILRTQARAVLRAAARGRD